MATCRIQRTGLGTIASAVIVTSDGQMTSVKPNSDEAFALNYHCPHATGTVTINDEVAAHIISGDNTNTGEMLAASLGLAHIAERPYDELLITWNKNNATLLPWLGQISQRDSVTIYNTERKVTESISGAKALDMVLRTILAHSQSRPDADTNSALQHAFALLTKNTEKNIALKTPRDTVAHIPSPEETSIYTYNTIDQPLERLGRTRFPRGALNALVPCDLMGKAIPSTTVVL